MNDSSALEIAQEIKDLARFILRDSGSWDGWKLRMDVILDEYAEMGDSDNLSNSLRLIKDAQQRSSGLAIEVVNSLVKVNFERAIVNTSVLHPEFFYKHPSDALEMNLMYINLRYLDYVKVDSETEAIDTLCAHLEASKHYVLHLEEHWGLDDYYNSYLKSDYAKYVEANPHRINAILEHIDAHGLDAVDDDENANGVRGGLNIEFFEEAMKHGRLHDGVL